MSKEMSKEKTNILLNCPFCNLPFKKIGSKRRGNQFFVHDKCMESNCILKGFVFKASEENFERWNTRIPMQNIVERLEEYRDDFMNDIYEELREDADNCRANRIIDRFDEAIEIVKEEGGLHELSS